MTESLAVAVMISGSGSNLQALIDDAARPGRLHAIELVISNRPGVFGLNRARASGIKTLVIDHRDYQNRWGFEAAIDRALNARSIGLICLAGFMRVLTADFVARWTGRLINIHPSILPAFQGLDTHRRALRSGALVHGCTVHQVTAELDAGPILVQGIVPVTDDDDVESLAARVLAMEHRCYPPALHDLVRSMVDGARPARRLLIDPVLVDHHLIET